MAEITIVVLSKDRLDCTKRFLVSLYNNTQVDFDIIIFDNGSSPETVKYLKKFQQNHALYDRETRVVFSKTNLGVGGARNKAFSMVKTKYIATFDNDMVFHQTGWLKQMKACMENHGAHAVYPIILDAEENVFSGKTDIVETPTHVSIRATKNIARDYVVNFMYGGACLMQTSLFKKLGNYGNFFVGLEDLDFAMRAKRSGDVKFMFCNKSRIIHEHRAPRNENDKQYERVRHNHDTINNSNNEFIRIWGKSALNESDQRWLRNRRNVLR